MTRRTEKYLLLASDDWHVDETYIRVGGKWRFLWRAINADGQMVDFRLSDLFAWQLTLGLLSGARPGTTVPLVLGYPQARGGFSQEYDLHIGAIPRGPHLHRVVQLHFSPAPENRFWLCCWTFVLGTRPSEFCDHLSQGSTNCMKGEAVDPVNCVDQGMPCVLEELEALRLDRNHFWLAIKFSSRSQQSAKK